MQRTVNSYVVVLSGTGRRTLSGFRRSNAYVRSITSRATSSTVAVLFRSALAYVETIAAAAKRITVLGRASNSHAAQVTANAARIASMYRKSNSHTAQITARSNRLALLIEAIPPGGMVVAHRPKNVATVDLEGKAAAVVIRREKNKAVVEHIT